MRILNSLFNFILNTSHIRVHYQVKLRVQGLFISCQTISSLFTSYSVFD